jgi:hypothetical protein
MAEFAGNKCDCDDEHMRPLPSDDPNVKVGTCDNCGEPFRLARQWTYLDLARHYGVDPGRVEEAFARRPRRSPGEPRA